MNGKTPRKVGLEEAENKLEEQFKGNMCCLTYITSQGYRKAYGIVDNISFDTRKLPKEKIVRVILNNTVYEVEWAYLYAQLKLLTKAK